MQTGLGRFGIGKLGPHNRPVSQALPSLPTFVPGNTVAKRKPGRPRKEVDSATAADLQKKQQQQQQQQQEREEQQQQKQQHQQQRELQRVHVKLVVVTNTTSLPWQDTRETSVRLQLTVKFSSGD